MLEHLYLIPLILGIVICIICFFNENSVEKPKDIRLIYDVKEAPFDNPISNKLFELSYHAPFNAFLPESSDMPKAQDQDKMFVQAGYAKSINYRVFGTVQMLLFMGAGVLTAFLGVFVASNPGIVKGLFNIDVPQGSAAPYLVIGCILMLLTLVPKMIFSAKASSARVGFVKDLPILQLFIVLMLKSQRSNAEIMYTLGKTKTRYREIFDVAYRISIRDTKEAYDYLRNAFAGTSFVDTITVLATSEEYSREDSIEVLEGRMEILQQDIESIKGDQSALVGLFSEGSIALPFLALMLLTVVPILVYAMNMMNNAGSGAF